MLIGWFRQNVSLGALFWHIIQMAAVSVPSRTMLDTNLNRFREQKAFKARVRITAEAAAMEGRLWKGPAVPSEAPETESHSYQPVP